MKSNLVRVDFRNRLIKKAEANIKAVEKGMFGEGH
jgi:hypothetical protein